MSEAGRQMDLLEGRVTTLETKMASTLTRLAALEAALRPARVTSPTRPLAGHLGRSTALAVVPRTSSVFRTLGLTFLEDFWA